MPKPSKSDTVRKMPSRAKGARLDAICSKTSWPRHTVHAFLSGLRKSGYAIERQGQGKQATYHLTITGEEAA